MQYSSSNNNNNNGGNNNNHHHTGNNRSDQKKPFQRNNNNKNNTFLVERKEEVMDGNHHQQQPLKPRHTQAYEQLQEKFKNPDEVKQKLMREKKRKVWEERVSRHTHVIQPSTSVILKGLSNLASEDDISNFVFQIHGLQPTRVRIVRDKATGQSRGFGFVDFATLTESEQFMDSSNGGMFIGNDYVELEYSHKTPPHSEDGKTDSDKTFKDWMCGHCNTKNFMHRTNCFGCSIPKDELAKDVSADNGEDLVTTPPTTELIVRSLNILTNETTLLSIFSTFGPVKACRIIRDKSTQMSRQFGFVEYFSVEDATNALSKSSELFIDGVRINVTYAKRQQSQQENDSNDHHHHSTTMASWNSLYSYTGTDQNVEEKQKIIETSSSSLSGADKSHSKQDQALAESGFIFDSQSGYYYNNQLNYYYDANTGYYYDCAGEFWMYYNEEDQTYVAVSSEETEENASSSTTNNNSNNKEQTTIAAEEEDEEKKTSEEKVIGPSLPAAATTTTGSQQDEEEKEQVIEVISSGGFVPNPKFNEQLKQLEKDIEQATSRLNRENSKSQQGVKRKRDLGKSSSNNNPEQLEKKEIDDNNVGKKMLEKLGWTKGEGLGKNKSGITAPISVKQTEKHSGLGFAKSNTTSGGGGGLGQANKKRKESYQKEGMKVLQKRFNELEKQE